MPSIGVAIFSLKGLTPQFGVFNNEKKFYEIGSLSQYQLKLIFEYFMLKCGIIFCLLTQIYYVNYAKICFITKGPALRPSGLSNNILTTYIFTFGFKIQGPKSQTFLSKFSEVFL